MNIIPIIRRLVRGFLELRVYDLSAQMAYYLLLSIFPFLLVIYSLLGYLPLQGDAILEMIEPFAPEETYDLIENTLSNMLMNRGGNLMSFSLIITFWLSSMGFQCVKRVLNDAYDIRQRKNLFMEILEGLLLTAGFMIAILFSVVIPVIEQVMRNNLEGIFAIEGFQSLWVFIRWGIGSLFIGSFFIGLYYFAPNIKLNIKRVLPGAIFATLVWQLVSYGFASYVGQNDYSALYGQLGGIVTLMIWFYISAMIIITGGLLNTVVHPPGLRKK
ncbi:YihY/virulence factor BrkB family protein [Virgibacillus natechei]|uniref:YihY/virulence factor BrkB family protein n=1 Tax=Virgibacillus sp. CBA3643 TaxID=2942278 RepID=UPI0035A3132F